MLFTTPIFLCFLVIVYVAFRLLPMGRPRTIFLVLASYVFYMSWNPPFVLLLIFSTILDYSVSLAMAREERPGRRKALLLASVVGNLSVLGFFKYANFFNANLQVVLSYVGAEFHPAPFNIILPLGISFYTFQTMSYTIDCYRRTREPTRDWLSFALFVTFFPQLIAGPIVRSDQFLPQVERHQRFTWAAFAMGCNLIMLGLVKKMVLADNLAVFVNQIYGNPAAAGTAQAWVATWAFTAEVYLDFSAYADIACGLGYLFGYRLPVNFRQPYLATGFRQFWTRWHITLMTWLRDYLYFPLGGSRRTKARNYFNLYVTLGLSGLWHGASWNFVIFGLVHGTYLVAERIIFGPKGVPVLAGWRRLAGVLSTVQLFAFSLVFFRAQTLVDSVTIFKRMFVWGSAPHIPLHWDYQLWVPLVLTIVGHALVYRRPLDPTLRSYPRWVVLVLYGAAAVGISLYGASGNEFIYFQF
jgi:alginate O-acetyltransferase complex protein AlgI